MRISLVVTTFNRGNLLGKYLLASLEERTWPDEVIVVDDGGTDDTRAVVERFAYLGMPMVYLYNNAPSVSNRCHATNCGIMLAKSEYILHTDPEVEFVTDIVRQFRDELPSENILAPEIGYHDTAENCSLGECFVARPGNGLHDNGGNAFLYKRDWILEIGGWDEDLLPGGFDDVDFHQRLTFNGHVQKPVRNAVVRHHWHSLLPWNAGREENSLKNKATVEGKHFPEDVVANKGREWGRCST